MQHIAHWCHAIDQPRILVAPHNLVFIARADEVAHHGAHHIVQCQHANHAAVFVHHHCKVFVRLSELLQYFRQRQPVWHDQRLAHQAVACQRNRLVFQRTLKQVLGLHITHHMVDVTFAHRVVGKRLGGNADADDRVGVVAQKESHALALRHGAGHRAGVQFKNVGNHLLLAHRQHTSACAGFHHGQHVVRGDAVVAPRRQAKHMEQAIGHAAVKPHQRVQCHDAKRHWARHAQCQPLGVGHGQALGEQVGQQDEQRSDDKERSQKSAGLRRLRRQPQTEKSSEMGRQRTFSDDAAQDGHRVQPHLHHGEIVARLLLHAQHPLGAHVALIGQLAQAQAARSGQRNFSDGKKGTRCNQQHDQQRILEHGKRQWAPERRTSAECSGRAGAALVVLTRRSQ